MILLIFMKIEVFVELLVFMWWLMMQFVRIMLVGVGVTHEVVTDAVDDVVIRTTLVSSSQSISFDLLLFFFNRETCLTSSIFIFLRFF